MNHAANFINQLYKDFWNTLNPDAMPRYYNKDATWHINSLEMNFDEMYHHVAELKKITSRIEQKIHKIIHDKEKISIWYRQHHYDNENNFSDQFNTITTLTMKNNKIQRVNFIWDKPEDFVNSMFIHSSEHSHLPETEISKLLSKRELVVFYYLIQGNTAKLIAERLSISARTVDSHINSIKVKTGLNNIKQIIEYAIERGYLVLSPLFTALFEEN